MICQPCNIPEDTVEVELEDVTDLDDASYTISFTSVDNSWVSFHDYIPEGIWSGRDTETSSLISLFNGFLYRHNDHDSVGTFYENKTYPSYITPVFTTPYKTEKGTLPMQLVNVSWNTDVEAIGTSDLELQNMTLSSISLHTSYQSTNEQTLIPFDTNKTIQQNYDVYNTRKVRSYWNFNKFRDMIVNNNVETFTEFLDDCVINTGNVNPTKANELLRRLEDDYVILKLKFNNALQLDLKIFDVSIQSKPVRR
jgi:hypothetical protein